MADSLKVRNHSEAQQQSGHAWRPWDFAENEKQVYHLCCMKMILFFKSKCLLLSDNNTDYNGSFRRLQDDMQIYRPYEWQVDYKKLSGQLWIHLGPQKRFCLQFMAGFSRSHARKYGMPLGLFPLLFLFYFCRDK